MGDKVVFRGAWVRYVDLRYSEGGTYLRIYVTAEFTGPVMEAMKWEDPGRSVDGADLAGELVGTHMVLQPNEKKQREHEIKLDVNKIYDFKLAVVTEKESTRRELRFIIRTPAPDAETVLGQYIRRVGNGQGALTISYSKQEELPMGEKTKPSTGLETEPDTGCVSCNNSIALDPNGKRHVNGVKCTRTKEASAAVQ